MKRVILILLIVVPFYLKAQVSIQTLGGASYVLNEKKVAKAELDAVPPADVVEIKTVNSAFTMVTKKFAIASYQEKLSQVCASYERYLTGHGTNDDVIAYNLDGKQLAKDNSGIITLYHLPKEKIADAVFTENEPEGGKFVVRIVITTKK